VDGDEAYVKDKSGKTALRGKVHGAKIRIGRDAEGLSPVDFVRRAAEEWLPLAEIKRNYKKHLIINSRLYGEKSFEDLLMNYNKEDMTAMKQIQDSLDEHGIKTDSDLKKFTALQCRKLLAYSGATEQGRDTSQLTPYHLKSY